MQGLLIFMLSLMIIASMICVMVRSKIKSALALAVVSVLLAVVMFIIGDLMSAIFELVICGGLLTVVLISAISMTRAGSRDDEVEAAYKKKMAVLPILMVFIGVVLVVVLALNNFNIKVTVDTIAQVRSFSDVLWNTRQSDILGQIVCILAGAMAVVILFKEGSRDE